MRELPFHQSIVEAIRSAGTAQVVVALGDLVVATVIPAGHEEILGAFQERWETLDFDLNMTDRVCRALQHKRGRAA